MEWPQSVPHPKADGYGDSIPERIRWVIDGKPTKPPTLPMPARLAKKRKTGSSSKKGRSSREKGGARSSSSTSLSWASYPQMDRLFNARSRFPHRMIYEIYKQQGKFRKYDIVRQAQMKSTLSWDLPPVRLRTFKWWKPSSWRPPSPNGNGTEVVTPDNEHHEVTLIGPNLPKRFPRHPSRHRIYPVSDETEKTSPPVDYGIPEYGDFPRPDTPTTHWGKDDWPENTSLLPFTIPLSSINRINAIQHPKIQDICKPDTVPAWKRCIMCGHFSSPVWKCIGCGEARYCSSSCLADDESKHKLMCNSFAPNSRFADVHRQSQDHFRALIFPAHSKTPELVWAHIHHSSYRHSPLDDNPDSDSAPPYGSPSLSFSHPDFWAFTKNFPKSAFTNKPMFTLGCLNQTLAFKKRQLGAGLFLLEWALPPNTDLPHKWVNRSIQDLGLPGHIWYWPGPILILSLDTTRPGLALRDITPRDVRHAIDYFQLNLRNPVLTDPLMRFPEEERSLALKLTDTAQPLAQAMGVTARPEVTKDPVFIASTPKFANEGISAMCAGLGLNWVFRDALCHGPEFDWLYDPQKTGTVLSGGFRGIYTVDEKRIVKGDSVPRLASLLSSGDGIVVAHRSGGHMYSHHLRALMEYVGWRWPVRSKRSEKEKMRAAAKALCEAGKQGFERFWLYYKGKERLTGMRCIPGPYELEERYASDAVRVGIVCFLGRELAKRERLKKLLEMNNGRASQAAPAKDDGDDKGPPPDSKGKAPAMSSSGESSDDSEKTITPKTSSKGKAPATSSSGESSNEPTSSKSKAKPKSSSKRGSSATTPAPATPTPRQPAVNAADASLTKPRRTREREVARDASKQEKASSKSTAKAPTDKPKATENRPSLLRASLGPFSQRLPLTTPRTTQPSSPEVNPADIPLPPFIPKKKVTKGSKGDTTSAKDTSAPFNSADIPLPPFISKKKVDNKVSKDDKTSSKATSSKATSSTANSSKATSSKTTTSSKPKPKTKARTKTKTTRSRGSRTQVIVSTQTQATGDAPLLSLGILPATDSTLPPATGPKPKAAMVEDGSD